MATSTLPTLGITGADVIHLVTGIGLLVAAVLPRLLRDRPVSVAMVFVAVGVVVGLLPGPIPIVDPQQHVSVTLHLTEVTVIVAIMGVGLSIDRPPDLRTWATTWRLLAVAMPLCIAAVAVSGWWFMGLPLASAVLLGAVLAPTDPVLAGDVQLEGPNAGPGDEVRFALTTEAGLNDGLAFPFVYLAIFIAVPAGLADWGWRFLAWEVAGKIVVGLLVGAGVGWLVARAAFAAPIASWRFAETGEAVVAIATVFLAYGAAEAAQGYGFLAVFAAALVIRQHERRHEYHEVLHHFVEELEQILTLVLLMLFGLACAQGLLADLTWRGVVVVVLLLVVVRPISGLLCLTGSRIARNERAAIAFFGVRGIGSLYYLAYATDNGDFARSGELWSTVALAILASVVLHGMSATPVMNVLERARSHRRSAAATPR